METQLKIQEGLFKTYRRLHSCLSGFQLLAQVLHRHEVLSFHRRAVGATFSFLFCWLNVGDSIAKIGLCDLQVTVLQP